MSGYWEVIKRLFFELVIEDYLRRIRLEFVGIRD